MRAGLQIKLVRQDTTKEHLDDEKRLVDLRFVDQQTRGGSASGRPVHGPSTALAGTPAPKGQDLAGFVTEVMTSFQQWDPNGYLWGGPGHWPLWVMLGLGRYRSDDGWAERTVRSSKLLEWKATGRWPWWRYHESEQYFWLPGAASSGRGFTGCLSQTSGIYSSVIFRDRKKAMPFLCLPLTSYSSVFLLSFIDFLCLLSSYVFLCFLCVLCLLLPVRLMSSSVFCLLLLSVK